MKQLWTWSGTYFGYRDGDNLWTYDGEHIGRFYGDEVFVYFGIRSEKPYPFLNADRTSLTYRRHKLSGHIQS